MSLRSQYRKTKTDAQIRLEARTAAVSDLQEIMGVIKLAGYEHLLHVESGSSGLLPVAHSLFKEHMVRIESEATEYPVPDLTDLDLHELGNIAQVPTAFVAPGVSRRSIIRTRPPAAYPEPEIGEAMLSPLCIRCGLPYGEHDSDNACPTRT